MKGAFWLIAPYAAWMALMTVLPATVGGYAVRTAVTAALLVAGWWKYGQRIFSCTSGRDSASPFGRAGSRSGEAESLPLVRKGLRGPLLPGLLVGLAVFAIWILPEQFDIPLYRRFCIIGEGGTQAVAEASAVMIAIRLAGSAFVISVAEELFFRKWLISFAGFWWMVALFAIEHDRWLVGAIAGVVYGFLYLRRGLGAAIIAHATTNLVLGLWVLKTGQWQFW